MSDMQNRIPYNIENFLSCENRQNEIALHLDKTGFKDVVARVKAHFESMFEADSFSSAYEKLVRQHEAIIGVPQAVNYYKDEIREFLKKHNLFYVGFPDYYQDLTNAIFQDLFGLGPLWTWFQYHESQAAYVIGTNLFFEIGDLVIKQPVSFESVDRVYELVRALILKDSKAKVNEFNPKLEIDMNDGTRVTLFVPPLSKQISLTFRRFVVDKLSIQQQAEKQTIPYEAIQLLKAINLTKPNLIIAGPVKSGKSTMLSTLYGEREVYKKAVSVEKHPELQLSHKFPDRPLDELVATEKELLNLFPSILRTDFSYLVVGELRSVEAELCMLGCERGSGGLLTTYHTKKPQNIPSQLARLILDYFPNRRYESELLRVAENIDLVIVMDELPDKTKKVETISEIRIDYENHRITVHDILQYDHELNDWQYRFDLSKELMQKMKKTAETAFHLLVQELSRLAQEKPIRGDNSFLSLDSHLIF